MEILSKTKDISERLFYIHECAVRAWDKYTLREYIKSGLYHKQGNPPNNFSNFKAIIAPSAILKVDSCENKDISLWDNNYCVIIIFGGLCFDSSEKRGDKG